MLTLTTHFLTQELLCLSNLADLCWTLFSTSGQHDHIAYWWLLGKMHMSNMCQQTEGNNKGLEAIFCLIYFPTCNQRPACLAVRHGETCLTLHEVINFLSIQHHCHYYVHWDDRWLRWHSPDRNVHQKARTQAQFQCSCRSVSCQHHSQPLTSKASRYWSAAWPDQWDKDWNKDTPIWRSAFKARALPLFTPLLMIACVQ